ncbi:monovalent cation/H+ antiporter subunit D [Methylobacillus gramineus]|uniref:monovalent cation/H+ antiporter subunit D n=1 Tax=Methylobacillus gramineus TaxID=755169 RepID=UPI001CFFB2CC|nr:monovalent cation/H+ antiporter subunit D [Methylobacillus gramineus]MCB5185115.1 monovalent cation/H+ antiporter subunit D [Methylobacillus gramineus]
MNHIAIAPLLLPLFTGICLLLLREQRIYVKRIIAGISNIALIVIAIELLLQVADGTILVYALSDWAAPYGITLVADRLAGWMVLTTSMLSIFALIYAMHGVDREGRHFHIMFQLQLFGLNGAFLTGDLFNLFVFFEVLLLASYSLLLHGGGRKRIRSGLHFVVINVVGSSLFLFAVGTLYGVLGTLNMADLAVKVAATPPENLVLVHSAGMLLFAVFALKAALLPFYLWLPSAYSQTSAPAAALFAIMTKVGAYSILRVYTLIFGDHAGPLANLLDGWLLPMALLTIAIGTFGLLGSKRLRQQVAYLVVISAGTLLTCFSLNSEAGIAAGLYYLPHTTFATAALFLLADLIVKRRGLMEDRLDAGYVITQQKFLGAIFFTLAILAAGLPPLSGFLGKFMLLQAALDHPAVVFIMTIVLLNGLLTVIGLARSGSLMFYEAHAVDKSTNTYNKQELPEPLNVRELLPIFALLGLCLAMTLWAGTLTKFTAETAAQLLDTKSYIEAVLGKGAP